MVTFVHIPGRLIFHHKPGKNPDYSLINYHNGIFYLNKLIDCNNLNHIFFAPKQLYYRISPYISRPHV